MVIILYHSMSVLHFYSETLINYNNFFLNSYGLVIGILSAETQQEKLGIISSYKRISIINLNLGLLHVILFQIVY